ncbi:MAG: hypothetical protein PVG39_11410, partial [Desulfobacteraceae bacterium]|jgi:hypothetical protein
LKGERGMKEEYVVVIGYSECWNDGVREILGPYTLKEAKKIEGYYDHFCILAVVFKLTKEK